MYVRLPALLVIGSRLVVDASLECVSIATLLRHGGRAGYIAERVFMTSSDKPLPTQQIGNYRLSRLLGRGGMGAVYEAVHIGVGGRAAIKLLRAEVVDNPDITQRFFDEARAANSVEHPSIIKIFDSGQTDDGLCYLAMEYLDGETLAHRIKVLGQLSVTSAIRFARQAASALSAVHQRGLIHRDLKPENLMIVRDPESAGGERIKVLDFGIARLTADLRSGDGTTETGIVMGTPMYMSPEQCHGAKQVTSQSDVYSLGIILYKMLAGRTPFTSPGLGALIAMHLTDVPVRVEQYNKQVPPPLSALLSEMLAKSPAERPTMSEVEARLRAMSRAEELPAPRSRNEAATQKLSPVALLALAKAQAGIAAEAMRPPDQQQQPTMLLPLQANGSELHSQPTGVLLTPRGRTRRLLRYLMAVSAVSLGAFVLVMVRGFAGQTSSAGAPPSLSTVPGPPIERTAPRVLVQDFATAPAVDLATGVDLLPVQRTAAKSFAVPRDHAPSPTEPSTPTPTLEAVPAASMRPSGLASSGPSSSSPVAASGSPDMASPSAVATPPLPYTKLPTGLRNPFAQGGKPP